MSDWKKVRLGNYIHEYSERNKDDADIPVYSVTNSNGFCTEYFSKEVASKDKTTYKIVRKGYFAYNPSRINVGSVDWLRNEDAVIVSPLYNVFYVDDSIDQQYLYYYLKSPVGSYYISELASGSVRDNLKLSILSEFRIPLPDIKTQKEIVATLDSIVHMISVCNAILKKIDLLVKSRFIELFGDPVSNPHKWDKIPLGELAEIKIGPFGTLLHKEDYIQNAHALVNPSHIIDGKIAIDMKLTVSDDKYNELSAYHLNIDDVVMGRRGEMGRCAVVSKSGLFCGTGSMIIRSNGRLKADYIQKIISFPSFKKTIEDMAVGQTMPNLNVPIVSNFMIICPPIEVQEQYYAFVEQTDKSKLAVKQVLEKAETLKKALMQEYFG